ncbi:hypothetical protein B0H19DRAFT_1252641 [Mycena capillaripes]|nr:hypothetical protein B0H19DRAFT_1252641 [Mycena capillaripes]
MAGTLFQQGHITKVNLDVYFWLGIHKDLCRVLENRILQHAPDDTIKAWPVPTQCRDKLEKITDSHVIRKCLVFDTDGSIVPPVEYPSKLLGALVECTFNLLHFYFGGKDNSFSSVINQIVILHATQIKPPSPFKAVNYRPPMLSPQQVHGKQQRAVNAFALPVSATAGPSNLPVAPIVILQERKASEEPRGSSSKRTHTDDNNVEIAKDVEDKDNEDIEYKDGEDTNSSGKGKGKV